MRSGRNSMAAVACALMTITPASVAPSPGAATQIINDAVRAGRIDAQVVTDFRTAGVTVALAYVVPPVRSPVPASGPDPGTDATPKANAVEWPVRDAAPPASDESAPSDAEVGANRLELQRSKADVVANTTRSRVLRAYPDLPVQQLEIHSEADLVRVLNAPTTVFVGTDVVFRPAISQALGLIHQVPSQLHGGAGTYVAVLDSGVDYTRPAFGSCVAPGVPATCRVALSSDFTAVDDGQLDGPAVGLHHGTGVSGIIAATAPDARLIVGDVFTGEGAYTSDILAGIQSVISRRIDGHLNVVALNLSLGLPNTFSCSQGDRFALATVASNGIQPVVASGNEARGRRLNANAVYTDGVGDPACGSPDVLSVGAVYDATSTVSYGWGDPYDATPGYDCVEQPVADRVACFSQSGPTLSMLAPGAFIDSAGEIGLGGTSFAAPFVAGAVALAASLRPELSLPGIRAALESSGTPILDNRNGRSTPRLDLASLDLQLRPANDLRTQPIDVPLSSGTGTGTGTVAFDNRLGQAQIGDPVTTGSGRTLWYRLTASSSTVALNVPAGSIVRAYRQGSPISALTDGLRAATLGPFDITSSSPIELLVDQLASAPTIGTIGVATTSSAAAPDNDQRLSARAVGTGVSTAITAFATSANDDLHHGSAPGHSVWFVWNPAAGSNVGISTKGTNFESSLVVFSGSSLTPVCEVVATAGANGALAQCEAASGEALLIGVDGVDGQHGTVVLSTVVLSATARAPVAGVGASPPGGQRSAAPPSDPAASSPGRGAAPPIDILA